MMPSELPPDYRVWLGDIKKRIASTRATAAQAVNRELLSLYWQIGSEILDKQKTAGWGSKVVDLLAADLHSSFPNDKGFSPRNLKYMRRFAVEWPDFAIVQDALAQLPWYQHIALLEKLPTREEREWYARAAVANGWSRALLVHHIGTRLHLRQGQALTNFASTMPSEQAEVATQLFKDPYLLDFVDLGPDVHERHLESALIDKIRNLLLELGKGFSFVGNQYPLQVGDRDFYLDLLFYHTKLHRYVVIDLKMTDFEPEFVGKMAFYLNAVDKHVATERDDPSIGLILCQGKNGLVVEYALSDVNKPMAVAEYRMLPPELAGHLPSIEDLTASLDRNYQPDEAQDYSGGMGGGQADTTTLLC